MTADHWNELERPVLSTKLDAGHGVDCLLRGRDDQRPLGVFRHAIELYEYKFQNHEPPLALSLH